MAAWILLAGFLLIGVLGYGIMDKAGSWMEQIAEQPTLPEIKETADRKEDQPWAQNGDSPKEIFVGWI